MKRKLGINIDCIGGGFDESVTLDIAHQTGFEVFTTSKRPIEMLSAIKEALMEAIQTTGAAEAMTTDELRWYKIERFLKKNGAITNADVRQIFQVSSATANRILAKFTDEGKLQKIRIGRSWGYQIQ